MRCLHKRQNELQWKPEYFPATRNWKVVALHNGVEVGTGISPNQKIAKEDAAREAVVYLRGKGMNIV
ncbi:hypothetical protein BKA62DRAFT_769509 [Auriculariales sp. MPI-PUGE-AT-0066]|nr:hypothetical protein BKA62DRAFT_769509 [Auriculariales sp. MPI-PUGE-AT-0066]